MVETYSKLLEQDYARQIAFNNVKWYHDNGYKGKEITVLNAEGFGDHREMTSGVLKAWAPESQLLESIISVVTKSDYVESATVTIDGIKMDFEEAIKKYNIKIVTRSYSGSSSSVYLNYIKMIQEKYGVIFINSAANEVNENGIWSKDDTAITVSACKLYEDGSLKVVYYGSVGEVDFTCFMARGRGTSAASPGLASKVALLLNRYGDFNQAEGVEILKSLCIKIEGEESYKFGYGLPILPLTDKLEILEKLRGAEEMQFKDVEDTRWSKAAIDRCVAEGLLVGFEDGTFRPTETVTREQFAVILTRILDKIEGR
jgi:hypothetical protein